MQMVSSQRAGTRKHSSSGWSARSSCGLRKGSRPTPAGSRSGNTGTSHLTGPPPRVACEGHAEYEGHHPLTMPALLQAFHPHHSQGSPHQRFQLTSKYLRGLSQNLVPRKQHPHAAQDPQSWIHRYPSSVPSLASRWDCCLKNWVLLFRWC